MIAIVNASIQEELVEMMGSEEFEDLLNEAAHQFEERSAGLMTFLNTADWSQARAMAHKIKGSMGTLGYDALFQSLDALERRLLVDPIDAPSAAEVEEIRQVISQTKMALPAI